MGSTETWLGGIGGLSMWWWWFDEFNGGLRGWVSNKRERERERETLSLSVNGRFH